MSILLIGERNRHLSSQKPRFADKEEIEDYRKAKKLNQNVYRHQLIEQMRQTEERRRQERQKQKQLDLKYQKIFQEQAYEYQQRLQNETKPNNFKFTDQDISPPPLSLKPNRKHHLVTLPQIQSESNNKFKPTRYQTEPNQYSPAQYNFSRIKSRLSTEPKTSPIQPQFYYSTNELESPEVRHKKLQEQLDIKLNEVYSLMAQSVKTLHQTEELDQIGTRLAPIKLNFERGYKVRYPEATTSPINNPEQNRDYYKLPSITKMPRQTEMLSNDSEVEWREWYAKQKLKELQLRYRKDLNMQASDIKLFNRRISTPKFRRPQY